MASAGYAWECECGHIEYGEIPPEECPKCHDIDSFTKLPEEIADERVKDDFDDETSN